MRILGQCDPSPHVEGVGHTSGPISYFAPSSGALITAASQGVGPNAADGVYASSSDREAAGDAVIADRTSLGHRKPAQNLSIYLTLVVCART